MKLGRAKRRREKKPQTVISTEPEITPQKSPQAFKKAQKAPCHRRYGRARKALRRLSYRVAHLVPCWLKEENYAIPNEECKENSSSVPLRRRRSWLANSLYKKDKSSGIR